MAPKVTKATGGTTVFLVRKATKAIEVIKATLGKLAPEVRRATGVKKVIPGLMELIFLARLSVGQDHKALPQP